MLPIRACCNPKTAGQARQPSGAHLLDARSLSRDQENILVQDLNALTFEERNLINEEVHGIINIVDETPDFVAAQLQAMRDQLGNIPKKKRKALDRAIFLRPGLRKDDKLHLLFLRAVRFDPIKAAGLMARHFEHKLELFGDEMLPVRITVDDLGERETELLKSGACTLLNNSVDRGGRGVYLTNACQFDIRDSKAFMRYTWYQVMSTLERDEEVQKRGVVQISNFYGQWKHAPSQLIEFILRGSQVFVDWPFRSVGYHLCYDQPLVSLFDGISRVAGKDLRVQTRFHFGSQMETNYALLSFGIRVADWLSPGRDMLSEECLSSYVDNRRRRETEWREKESSDSKFAGYATRQMVLMGRGRPYREWLGNAELSKMVAMHADRYMGKHSDYLDKGMVAMEIVQRIQIDGGRFAQRTDEGWETVDDQVAKEKVSQALRTEVRQRNNGTGTLESDFCPSSSIDTELPQQKRLRIR